MITCSTCHATLDDDALNCSACGLRLAGSFTATRHQEADLNQSGDGTLIQPHPEDESLAETRMQKEVPKTDSKRRSATGASASGSASRLPSLDSYSQTRFAVGSVLAERYRILGQLGKGGMGEVYRAEDLKLGLPVALKFLPEELTSDGAMLARFHREVRIARQVSHPNVCRVFDIGEVDGQHFLSMEYIDGEDLASLMRRIGRLPQDKAIEISRQICAGLAAAHDSGVLHRDLKPANIMLDGRGKARITDFGLAGLAEEISGDDVRSGTPAYMAPEQLAGKEVSVKSDIYSLGLVLYEIFTGKRVFEAASLMDLITLQENSLPVNMSAIVKEIDPLVEKVIHRCLEKDPLRRPQSALQIAAALPGGDPLAAALAAGETPSPEMVAAAAKQGALRPLAAISLLAAAVVLIIFILFLASKTMLQTQVPLEKSADVLADRANTIAKKLGYTYTPADTAYGFGTDEEYLNYVKQRDATTARWKRLAVGQPAALYFWYRQSPRPFLPLNGRYVMGYDPPMNITGMVFLELDGRGRLIHLLGVPPQYDEAQEKPPATDWAAVFAEAGLQQDDFKEAPPRWIANIYSDTRVAWDGVFPEATDIPLHIEAASYRGKPVYFSMLSEWNRPFRMEVMRLSAGARFFTGIMIFLFTLVILAGMMLARRHLKQGRGDRKGAFRLAAFIFAINMLGWAFRANHIASPDEISLLITAIAWSLLFGVLMWILYIALEPYVRRKNPERIIAWSRLLAGDFRDPLIGRDLLIGGLVGITLALLVHLSQMAPGWLGMATDKPLLPFTETFLGMRGVFAAYVQMHQGAILAPMGLLFFFLLVSMLWRRERPAVAVLWLVLMLITNLGGGSNLKTDLLFTALASALLVFTLIRFGLLATIAAQLFLFLFTRYPHTPDLSVWYAQGSIFAISAALLLVGFGFYTSLADERLFKNSLLSD